MTAQPLLLSQIVGAPIRRRRGRTIQARKVYGKEKEQLDLLFEEVAEFKRPQTRAECVNGPRPCLFVSCKYHLYLDVHPVSGSIKINFPHIEPDQMTHSCVLDLADKGGITLEDVGSAMNLTRERVRQLETVVLEKLKASGKFDEHRGEVSNVWQWGGKDAIGPAENPRRNRAQKGNRSR